MTRGRLPGGGRSSVVDKRETRLYEPEERLHSSSKGVKTGAFCSASRQPSTFYPISFHRLVLYCAVSDQIDLLS
nr:NADH dehydrogenase subunit 5 [Ipomoea batatas]